MAASNRDDSPTAPQPAKAPAVIQHTPVPEAEGTRRKLRHILPAWIFSSAMHALFLSLFLFVSLNPGAAKVDNELVIVSDFEVTTEPSNLRDIERGFNQLIEPGLDQPKEGLRNIIEVPDLIAPPGVRDPNASADLVNVSPPFGKSNSLGAGSKVLDRGSAAAFGPGNGTGLLNGEPGGMGLRRASGETRRRSLLNEG